MAINSEINRKLTSCHMLNSKTFFASCIIYFAFCGYLFSQKYSAVASEISFYSEAPLEKIQAVNKEGKSVLNLATGEIAFVIPIRGFHFAKALMEEHFNENYLESDKYKIATFKAKTGEKIDVTKDGEYDATVTGKMNIHGVEKEYTLSGKIKVSGGKISIDSKFNVRIADHKIEIPQLVVQNIAEVVEVTVHFDYEEKK